jgi:LysR family nitrogen assimilation transcriptional regulator
LPLTPAGEIVQGLIIQDVQRRLAPGAWLGARSLAALDEV